MTSLHSSRGWGSLALALALLFPAPSTAQSDLPGPKEALDGHEIGEDYFLANYTQLKAWWTQLAEKSDRMELDVIGTTSYGQEMVMAVISSPENLARREEIRQISERMARGWDADRDLAEELADKGRAVIWIDGGLHATESIAGQNPLELVWNMVSGESKEIHRILDEVVLLVCPANPDGMEMIANNYMAIQRVGSTPVLYQRYIGHDNNRDFYANNMPEARAISRQLYLHWFPQVIYNHHQTAPRGTIIFTPPFRDPFNHNFDPLIVRGIDLVSAHMNHRFTKEGKAGVISETGASYSTWWNGGLRTTAYFHNMVGILTEAFGSPTPSTVTQALNRRVPYGDYPLPIETQPWHARDTIDYLYSSDLAILDLASRYRRDFLTNMWVMARNSIERGSKDHWTMTPKLLDIARSKMRTPANASGRGGGRRGGGRGGRGGRAGGSSPEAEAVFTDPSLRDPRAYIMAKDQLDPASVTRYMRALRRSGVDVHVATEDFTANGKSYSKGSYVVQAAQAFRPHLRDMFEPQYHPDDIGASGEPIRPYDSAGWTLAMQMGVEVDKSLEAVEGPFAMVEEVEVEFQPGEASRGTAGYLVSHGNSNSYIAANRLLASGEKVYWLKQGMEHDGQRHPVGTMFVAESSGTFDKVAAMAAELGLDFVGLNDAPKGAALQLKPLRIGLFDSFGGNMPTGWTEWILKDYEFPVELVYGKQINAGNLNEKFDVLMFLTGLPRAGGRDRNEQAFRRGGQGRAMDQETLDKIAAAMPPWEDWSNLADRRVSLNSEESIPSLKAFVEGGGTLVAIGNQTANVIAHFDLPIGVGPFVTDEEGNQRPAPSSEFFIPGSLVWTDVDTNHPIGYGAPARLATMFRRSPVLLPGEGIKGPVTYADQEQLASGWAIGQELLKGGSVMAGQQVGNGQVLLYGADVLYRGQPTASYKLVFNGLYASTAEEVNL